MRFSDGEYLSTYHRVRSPAPDNNIPEVRLALSVVFQGFTSMMFGQYGSALLALP